jgi:hypothetical protein
MIGMDSCLDASYNLTKNDQDQRLKGSGNSLVTHERNRSIPTADFALMLPTRLVRKGGIPSMLALSSEFTETFFYAQDCLSTTLI